VRERIRQTNHIARHNALVPMEDLHVKSMARTAKGAVEAPGKNVAQKAGLNREILDTGNVRHLPFSSSVLARDGTF
jgi:putative transposase